MHTAGMFTESVNAKLLLIMLKLCHCQLYRAKDQCAVTLEKIILTDLLINFLLFKRRH